MSRARNYCFTLNNYMQGDVDFLQEFYEKGCVYLIYGKEVGESGTKHLQGMFTLTNASTIKALVKTHLKGYHLEVMKGTFKQASDYCKKDGDSYEFGILPMDMAEKGKKGAAYWEDCVEKIEADELDELPAQVRLNNWPQVQAYRGRFKQKQMSTLQGQLEHKYYHGIAGCGKSRKVRELYPEAYIKDLTKWWTNYNYEETVIIEDISPDCQSLDQLFKVWTDRYPFQAETKGGGMLIRPKLIIFTSQYSTREVWTDPIQHAAMARRLIAELMGSPQPPPDLLPQQAAMGFFG